MDALVPNGDVAHDVEHPALELWEIEIERDMAESLAHVLAGKTKDALGLGGEAANAEVIAEHNHGYGGAVEQVDEIVAQLRELLVAMLDLFVDSIEFLVGGLEFFLGSLQLFVGAL